MYFFESRDVVYSPVECAVYFCLLCVATIARACDLLTVYEERRRKLIKPTRLTQPELKQQTLTSMASKLTSSTRPRTPNPGQNANGQKRRPQKPKLAPLPLPNASHLVRKKN